MKTVIGKMSVEGFKRFGFSVLNPLLKKNVVENIKIIINTSLAINNGKLPETLLTPLKESVKDLSTYNVIDRKILEISRLYVAKIFGVGVHFVTLSYDWVNDVILNGEDQLRLEHHSSMVEQPIQASNREGSLLTISFKVSVPQGFISNSIIDKVAGIKGVMLPDVIHRSKFVRHIEVSHESLPAPKGLTDYDLEGGWWTLYSREDCRNQYQPSANERLKETTLPPIEILKAALKPLEFSTSPSDKGVLINPTPIECNRTDRETSKVEEVRHAEK